MNFHYCKLADDCNWCNVPFCPYEKDNDVEDDNEDVSAQILSDVLDGDWDDWDKK